MLCPGAANALTARLVELAGFDACYVTGAGIANTWLGVPDIGLVTLTEVADHVRVMADATELPLVVDADTGFGNAIGVQRTVRVLEQAGAAAIQLEDQVSPKRCGHFAGKAVVSTQEMLERLGAALDARDETLVIARTDARSIEGFDAAVERAQQYAEAGADLVFLEAPQSREELLSVPSRVPGVRHVANLVDGGRTPLLPASELGDFSLVLYANLALQATIHGVQQALGAVRDAGTVEAARPYLASWEVRQEVVRKPAFDALEQQLGQVGS